MLTGAFREGVTSRRLDEIVAGGGNLDMNVSDGIIPSFPSIVLCATLTLEGIEKDDIDTLVRHR